MPRDAYYLPKRRLISQEDAAVIQPARVPRSRFINQYTRLTTFNQGDLVPFLIKEVLPGDHWQFNIVAYIRMATALFPMMSNLRFDTHIFYTPNRLVYENWTRLMGEQPTGPADTINFTVPVIDSTAGGYAINTIYDHMGLPTAGQVTAGQVVRHSALPLRMYNLIYNQWFRDQNIINAAIEQKNDGPDNTALYAIRKRAKSHDYFTSALPWPQKFTPLQTLFTGTAPIVGIGALTSAAVASGSTGNLVVETDALANTTYAAHYPLSTAGMVMRMETAAAVPNAPNNTPLIYADLARATGVTINALRQAWLVQDMLERDARGGTRYVELIWSHFRVRNPDFRLQRPEYIGGGQTPINLTPIAQTTPTGGGGLGALGATGTAAGQHRASYAATEHGYIIGILSVKSELLYQQGLHRHWSRSVRQDFYIPTLAGLGEQAILRQEIYANGVDAEDSLVFGYQERWQELRTDYSTVTGMFKSTTAGNIDEWHLGQQFSPAPTLSQAFIEDTAPMSRVLAAGAAADNQQFLADIMIQQTVIRPIPTFGTPATLSRF